MTDQAPMHKCPFCESGMLPDPAPAERRFQPFDLNDPRPIWEQGRPPSERPVAQVREALEKIAEFCSADATTLGAIDRLAQVRDVARAALTAERPEAAALDFETAHMVSCLRGRADDKLCLDAANTIESLSGERPEAAVPVGYFLFDGNDWHKVHEDFIHDPDVIPLYRAIQHEEPGRETMTSVPKTYYMFRGGPGFDYPCADPNIIECADDRCQEQQRCRKSPTHSPLHRGI